MTKIISYVSKVALVLMLTLVVGSRANAYENFFQSAMGEIDPAVLGDERVIVTQEGGLMLTTNDGTPYPLFPYYPPSSVVTSSPVLADVDGDTIANEIIFTARTVSNNYRLFVMNQNGLIAESNIVGTAYYPPVAINADGDPNMEILVPTDNGQVYQYDYVSGTLSATPAFNTGQATGLMVRPNGNELIANFPGSSVISFYHLMNGNWVSYRNINLLVVNGVTFPNGNTGALYPVTEDEQAGIIYTIRHYIEDYGGGTLIAIGEINVVDSATGNNIRNVSVFSPIVGSLALVEYDPTIPGLEIAATVGSGSVQILNLVNSPFVRVADVNKLSGKSNSVASADHRHQGLLVGIYSTTVQVINRANQWIASLGGQIRIPFGTAPLPGQTVVQSLSATQASLVANDTQEIRATLRVTDALNPDVQQFLMAVNYNDALGITGSERGRFKWDPTNGFTEDGGATSWGNQHVTLLPMNPANPSSGSEYVPNLANNTIELVFRYTIVNGYGNVADNDVSYEITGNGYTVGWNTVDTSFAVNAAAFVATSFNGLTIDQPTVTVNTGTASDVQVARMSYTVNNPASHDITNVQITLDYNPANGLTGTAERGRIGWTPARICGDWWKWLGKSVHQSDPSGWNQQCSGFTGDSGSSQQSY
ncbi:hypothetical protein IPJ72_03100 [Candidatus Peregrinibacteria bacterium]|nr:MAG: hypothetical protein IPJ72_03100 [Candidatus Peregrinibacteria bacterium]